MLDIRQIESFYPEHLRSFKRNLLREYLQYKILETIFASEFADALAFMGGTAIHIVHSNPRFSEDLDFDNLDLNESGFKQLVELIARNLDREGYGVETRSVFKNAYRSYLRIPGILSENRLSGHREEKLLIQLDAEPQNVDYRPDKVILNKFDIFMRINVVPKDILLAQKFYAIFHRKRPMGRDFYDAVFLLAMTGPNLDYLKDRLQIKSMADLKRKLLTRCKDLDFEQLTKDVEPYLSTPGDSRKVLLFPDYIKTVNLESE